MELCRGSSVAIAASGGGEGFDSGDVRRDRRPCPPNARSVALWPRCRRSAPTDLRIIGTARTDLDDKAFREHAREALKEHLPAGFYADGIAERFLSRLQYVPLDIKDSDGFRALAERVGDPCHGVAIFLSTAPSLFKPTIDGLEAAGLACPTVRMALEKPLGFDLDSSREINDAVAFGLPRGPHLPDRPLSRQGDGPEPARPALRQLDVRAVVEQRPYRSCPDHGRGDDRARRPRRLL